MKRNTPLFWIALLLGLAVLFLLLVYPGYLRRKEAPPENPPVPDLTGRERELEVTLFFPNQEYIQTGRADLPMLKEVKRTVEANDENLVAKVLAELRKPPAAEGFATALHDELKIRAARREGRRAYVDFSSENLFGGSLQETLLVHQIVWTLTALPGIDEVQFLVEGEKRESLMGHISTDEPLRPDQL
ncbi:MAG: GerMN domain-containing protein [Firmicutes bacterium]|nr:GerMN domain-containing protein [Bacillota bacterium]